MAPPTHIRFDVDRVGVAFVLLDRAGDTLNTLDPELLAEFDAILDRCESDHAVRAVVIGSAKQRSFAAGADLRWLSTLEDREEIGRIFRQAHALMGRLEALWRERGKPVVAAVHGACLGGGLEIALACAGRVASTDPDTRLGQPEIKLGLIPGAGGTQRLPRLVGVATGLELILTGRSLRPGAALAIGLVDELCSPDDLMETARRRAVAAIGGGGRRPRRPIRRPGDVAAAARRALEGTRPGRRFVYGRAAATIRRTTRGNYPAAPAALRAVRTGIEDGFAAGSATEIAEFSTLLLGAEARALISLFFASQSLKNETTALTEAAAGDVRTLAIIGGGLMGTGIAAVSAGRAGAATIIKEVDRPAADRALERTVHSVSAAARRRGLSAEPATRLVSATTEDADLAAADLVIEAVFEDLALKREVLRAVEAVTGPNTVFASNTSSIPIGDIAGGAERPNQVVGMHYFSPVERMPLLEVVATEAASESAVATSVAFGRRQAKTVIVVNDGPGFFTTRILVPYAGEALHLLADGASIGEIDAAMVAWGFPVGPFNLSDEVGIDVGAKIAGIMEQRLGGRLRVPEAYAALSADGRRGRKNGRGFYHYVRGKRRGVDESVYDVMGVAPRPGITREEIQDRLSLAMINEAVRCLEEGVLRSARDGDVGAVMGIGFPPFRGGPFFYTDRAGAAEITATMESLADRYGERFAPADLLSAHAASGRAFRTDA